MPGYAHTKALNLQSFTIRRISTWQLPAPMKVLHFLIREYTPFCLLKFLGISVEPSNGFAVLDVTIKAVHGLQWPGISMKREESLPKQYYSLYLRAV